MTLVVTLERMMMSRAGTPRPSDTSIEEGLGSPVTIEEIMPTNMKPAAPARDPISVPTLEEDLFFA